MAYPLTDIQIQDIKLRLANTRLPIFVARVGGRDGATLEVGTLARHGHAEMRREIEKQLPAGSVSAVRVVRHPASQLARIRSLESLISATGEGAIVFDRTRALGRAEAVVTVSRKLRAELGKLVDGIYFEADRRTLFVTLTEAARSDMGDASRRTRVMSAIEALETERRANQGADAFELAVRVGFDVPSQMQVTAVDKLTARAALVRMLRWPLRSKLGHAIIGTLIGASVAVPAMAADLSMPQAPAPVAASSEPAVDAPNLSIGVLGGGASDPVDFNHLWSGIDAKGAIPLGDRFGAQLDLGAATDQYYGAALHLFARDPSTGLIGVMGSTESQYGITMNRLGVEGEYYITDNFTIAGRAGYQTGSSSPDGAFGRVDVKFYADPNFVLKAGVETQPSFNIARGGFEWRPAMSGLAGMSLSADASAATNGDYRAMFGLHFQFGGAESQTLLDRDRKSDPDSALWNVIDTHQNVAYAGPSQPN